MFRRIREERGRLCRIVLDGEPIEAPEGTNLAALLFTLDAVPNRHNLVSGEPRAPYCLMGVCFECLVEIDGIADQQACLATIREGMTVRRRPRANGRVHNRSSDRA